LLSGVEIETEDGVVGPKAEKVVGPKAEKVVGPKAEKVVGSQTFRSSLAKCLRLLVSRYAISSFVLLPYSPVTLARWVSTFPPHDENGNLPVPIPPKTNNFSPQT
jgi:hypothetical protein